MEIKKQIENILETLIISGKDRSSIEQDLGYSENYIDQTLARGGNKRFLKVLEDYSKSILQKTIKVHGPLSSDNAIHGKDGKIIHDYDRFLEEILAEKDQRIKQAEAHRVAAEEFAKKMEAHYEDAKADKEKLFIELQETRKTISDVLQPMAASLKGIPPVLDIIVRNSNEHDQEIMNALDHLVGNEPGQLLKDSGKRILKGALERQKKDKKAGAGK